MGPLKWGKAGRSPVFPRFSWKLLRSCFNFWLKEKFRGKSWSGSPAHVCALHVPSPRRDMPPRPVARGQRSWPRATGWGGPSDLEGGEARSASPPWGVKKGAKRPVLAVGQHLDAEIISSIRRAGLPAPRRSRDKQAGRPARMNWRNESAEGRPMSFQFDWNDMSRARGRAAEPKVGLKSWWQPKFQASKLKKLSRAYYWGAAPQILWVWKSHLMKKSYVTWKYFPLNGNVL